MTTDDRTLEAAMAGLATHAPSTLAPDVLVEVGLADRFARMDSPIGPLVVAWNGLGVSGVDVATDDTAFEAAHTARTGRPTYPAAELPPRLGDAITPADRRRPARPHRSGPARPHRLRARRLGEGPGDPARRSPAVRLDRRGDRPARRPSGPSGPRSATIPSRSSSRATGSCARTARSASTRSVGRPTSGRSFARRASIRTGWSTRHGSGSASSGRTRPTSSACRPAITPSASPPAHRVPFRSFGDAVRPGYRACRSCKSASGASLAAA